MATTLRERGYFDDSDKTMAISLQQLTSGEGCHFNARKAYKNNAHTASIEMLKCLIIRFGELMRNDG